MHHENRPHESTDEPHDGFAEEKEGFSYVIIYLPRLQIKRAINSFTRQKINHFRFRETVIHNPILRTQSCI